MNVEAADFELVCRVVHERAGIVLEAGKEYLVASRLASLVRREGLASVELLVEQLRARPHGPLVDRVVDAMTTNETSFFRDAHVFEALRATVIPAIVNARQTSRRITIWSAGCASGQEPYSIAMLLADQFPELADWDVRIVGTDVASSMIDRARRARFSQLEVNRGLPASSLVKHFSQDGATWSLSSTIAGTVEFNVMNLLASHWPGVVDVDLVLMRNVLMYFDVRTRSRVLDHVTRVMAADGYLFLGSSESMLSVNTTFEPVELVRARCFRQPTRPELGSKGVTWTRSALPSSR